MTTTRPAPDGSAHAPTTVVAVHGNGGGSFRFAPAAPHVPWPVRMVAPDLPGFGGRPLDDPAPDLATFTNALRVVVEQAREDGASIPDHRVVVLGHGIGGAVALDLLCGEPDLADGLVLHAPVGTRLDTRWFPRLMASPAVRETARRAIASDVLKPVWRRTIARTMPRDTADAFLEGYDDCPAFGVMFDLLTSAWFDSLATLDLPSVLLWGSDDRVLGADQRSDYHRLLPDATEVVVDGWGHFPMLADPADYAWRMAAVVAGVAARADVAAVGSPRRVVPLASAQLSTLGVPGKAARLEALPAGLVPQAVVVPEAMAVDPAAAEVAAWMAAASGAAGRRSSDAERRVAVRSAFGAEDGTDRSLAGAFDSLLDVPLPAVARPDSGGGGRTWADGALADAISHVRASADDADLDDDLGVEALDRCVLVMTMVEARVAGVAFLEPGFVDDLVEFIDGLADGLVSGTVDAERLALPRRDLTGEAVTGWPARLQHALAQVRAAMGDAGRGDAGRDDAGWDVEWADDGTTCHVVQVRPITAPVERDAELTLANHREILPDLPSAFMTSLVVDAGDDVFAYWQRFDDDVPRGRAFTEEFAGRPWINLSLLVDTMRVLGLPASFVTDTMGGASEHDAPLRPSRVARKAATLAMMGVDQLRAVQTAEEAVADLAAMVADLPEAAASSACEAVDLAHRAYVRLLLGIFPLSTAISGPLAALSALGVTADLFQRQRTEGSRVLDDLGAVRDAAKDDGDLLELVAHGRGLDGAEPSARVVAAWQDYLDAHGHRGIYESDLARPRYREAPTPLLDLLDPERERSAAAASGHARRGAGGGADDSDFVNGGVDGATGRPTWLDRAAAVAARPVWWQASRAMRARERLRSEAMRTFEVVRGRLLAAAARAAIEGQLPAADDVWDLDVDEVRALDTGAVYDRPFLEQRREERNRLAELRLPDLVRRSDDPEDVGRTTGVGGAGGTVEVSGRGLTRGTVDGNVVVLDEPGSVEHVEAPRVLVARGVDGGWVSVFANVDAVVVETGGELSHGSIILRELAIPAVTNARGAASVLADGDRVRVAARAGTVRRLDA